MTMVSFIIPTYNRLNTLVVTIESILKQQRADYEIIVVDDLSTDGTPEVLKERFKGVKVITTGRRSGPSYARNIAIREARGKYVWFLDSDTALPDERLIDRMVSEFESLPKAGSLGGEIVVPEGLLDRAYGRKVRWDAKNERVTAFKGAAPVECDYLATCNCFTTRELLLKVDGFDERFVFGAEDMDLGAKLKKAGMANYVGFDVAVHHFHEKAGRYNNETERYQFTRIQFAKKHYAMPRLSLIFLNDLLFFLYFYLKLPPKLVWMSLKGMKIAKQNVIGGWNVLKFHLTR